MRSAVWTKSVFTVISELSESVWMLAVKTGFVFDLAGRR